VSLDRNGATAFERGSSGVPLATASAATRPVGEGQHLRGSLRSNGRREPRVAGSRIGFPPLELGEDQRPGHARLWSAPAINIPAIVNKASSPARLRGTLYQEDKSQVRTRSGPRIMASMRNLAISALRLAGASTSPKPPDGQAGR
jgi:hypothetical protein